MRHKLVVILSLAVAFLAVSSVIFVPHAGSSDIGISVSFDNGTVSMSYLVKGGQYDRSVTAIMLEVSRVHQGHIYVLINEGLNFDVKVSLHRMVDHFNNELSLLGSEQTATIIGTDDLPKVFSDLNAVLIAGPGADLPFYYSYPAIQWVGNGGLWVGIGNGSAPFMYSVDNTGSPNATIRMDFVALDYNGGEGARGTPMADALGLRYIAPEYAFRLGDLEAAGGKSIGYEFERDGGILATAGIVPIGKGSLLVLAGNMGSPPLATSEEVVAWDLMKMILLNVPWWSGNMRYETGSATGVDLVGNITMRLSGSDYVCCGVMSNVDSFSGFRVERVPVPDA